MSAAPEQDTPTNTTDASQQARPANSEATTEQSADKATDTGSHGATHQAPIVWIDTTHVDDPDLRSAITTTALEQGFSHILVRKDTKDALLALGRFQALALHETDHTNDDTATTNEERPTIGDPIIGDDGPIGRIATIRDKHDEAKISALAGHVEHMVVAATDWKIIPLENLIADYQPTTSHLLAQVHNADEARVMLDTLDVGTDGILLSTEDAQQIIDLATILTRRSTRRANLETAEIIAVTDVGKGDRVCIDTCSILGLGEGMLIGNSAQGMFLVHAESLESPYVNARPFRVNAGAVHAYVQGTEGRTHYLSEVQSGLELIAIDHDGQTRTVTVGRAKVETRPLLLVEATLPDDPSGRRYGIVVQNAETIRFVTPDGGALSVVDARPGDKVLITRSDAARHFGRAIKENLVER